MDVMNLIIGLILAAIVWYVAAIFLPSVIALLLALLVVVLCLTGGVRTRL